jgi:hypothetical protein
MVKMANIVPLIIYLLIYIFPFFFRQPLENKQEEKKVSFWELGSRKVALRVRVTKFHKLATTEAFLSLVKQMKIQAALPHFDLFNKEQQSEGAKTKAENIEIPFKLL